jgi:NAD(P)-dependent dehydrogenase (short-subunit alcohol dehydrogenase family)
MRPVSGQTVLITGSTAGLGLETARALLGKGATVMVHGRSPDRVERALATLARPYRTHGVVADFSSLEEVRRLARGIARECERLDLLINNAGIALWDGPRRVSADGYELTFAVNYLSHFLLTRELLPLLERSAPARIVNIASIGQAPIDFDDVMLEREYDGRRAYGQSKLGQIEFTIELAERLERAGQAITVNAIHPATLMDTNLARGASRAPLSSVAEGVAATVRLAIAPELDDVSGRYYEGLEETTADPQAYGPEARARLWQLSERLCGIPASA